MDTLFLADMLGWFDEATMVEWLQSAFYPTLFGILVMASLGIPIPEDIPLIASGVVLANHPEVASWGGTLIVALLGIMSGDLVLYTFGRLAGPNIVRHRLVRWMITPRRYAWMVAEFHKHGIWACFFGRFIVGVRAVMCMTAGATRYPYWKFFLADCAGATLSIPLFVWLGYWFAGMIPTLRHWLVGVNSVLAIIIGLAIVGLIVYFKIRAVRRATRDLPDVRQVKSVTSDKRSTAA